MDKTNSTVEKFVVTEVCAAGVTSKGNNCEQGSS